MTEYPRNLLSRTTTPIAAAVALPAAVPTVVAAWQAFPRAIYATNGAVKIVNNGANPITVSFLQGSDVVAGTFPWNNNNLNPILPNETAFMGFQGSVPAFWQLTLTSALGTTADVSIVDETTTA